MKLWHTVTDLVDAERDKDVFIVGCGTSIEQFGIGRLQGKVVIALNRAAQYFDAEIPPTYLLWHDPYLWTELSTWTIPATTKLVTSTIPLGQMLQRGIPEWIERVYVYTVLKKWFHKKGVRQLRRQDALFPEGAGISSIALWLAWVLGARRVFLLGIDGYWFKDRYYGKFDRGNRRPRRGAGKEIALSDGRFCDMRSMLLSGAYGQALWYMQTCGAFLGSWPGPGVYNLSPRSLITAFEKVKLEDVL